MRYIIRLVFITVLSLSLGACANKQDAGTLTGAAVGGLLGSQFGSGTGKALAVMGGAITGAVIGNSIGRHMDKVDRLEVQHALEGARDGQTKAWSNPNTGYRYKVTPTKTYYRTHHRLRQPCREYTTTAIIGGKQQRIYGKACRTRDGDWRVVSG